MTFRQVKRVVFYVFGIALLSVLVCSCCGSTSDETRPTPTLEIEVGSRRRLKEETPICLTKEDLDELRKALAAKDQWGFTDQLMSGRLFFVPQGTEVLIIEWDGSWNYFTGAVKVRVMEGEFTGQAGWAFESYIG